MARASADTPVMRQYLTAKEAHPDALLFFRLGDFYELFFEDAVVAARALDLTLTSRNKGAEDPVPMAGVPYHAVSSYVQRLLEQGHKVAICEQMADPATVKGIVPREVVRVVRPGIAFDDAGLEARVNHFLGAVDVVAGAFGVAMLDVSTGELSACEAPDAQGALAEVVRLDPRELLLGPGAEGLSARLADARPGLVLRDDGRAIEDAAAELDQVLGQGETAKVTTSLPVLRAAARVVSTARACEIGRPLPVTRLAIHALGDTLVLDGATVAHLELVRANDGSTKTALLAQVDETLTAPGARLLRRRLLSPLARVADVRRRADEVELFVTQPGLRSEVRARLGKVRDLVRLSVKLQMDRAQPKDLAALRASLAELPAIARALETCPDPAAQATRLDVCEDLASRLVRDLAQDPPQRVADGGVLRTGCDAELDELRAMLEGGQKHITLLEARLREQTQIGTLKVRYTRVFGWYLEVTRTHLDKVPAGWRRKQTIAGGERFTCAELDELADKLAHAEEGCAAREAELYVKLVSFLARHVARLRAAGEALAVLDVTAALAEVAHRNDYVRPEVDDGLVLDIEDGRHAVVERMAAAGRFVPNDVRLDAAQGGATPSLWLVTGPNMAGKSTLMRQTALIVLLAQMGSFVPARRAKVGIVDRILTRVGASDNLARGESTFMVEMKETATVLRRATRRSLVLLDEIGRGTSTYDGLAIAWSVAEYLHDVLGCRAIFATHYHELTELAQTCPRCENWSVSAREHEGDIVFLHKLQRGPASRSYGVACARLAGLPEAVLARAKVLLDGLEEGGPLPGGARASLRAKDAQGRAQLDLFRPARPDNPAMELLRAVDVDRLTPIEALQLVLTLKKQTLA